MASHTLRRRPEGRLQCLDCRAAFLTEDSARQATAPCEGRHLPHGHRYNREHVVYPTWYDQGSGIGPDRLCDEPGCFCVQHTCDCDVCREVIRVPALSILLDSREGSTERITPMSPSTVSVHLPAQLRKHIERAFAPEDQAGLDLVHSVKALNQGNAQSSVKVNLTNAQLGVYLDLARNWSTSSNGNEKRASQSVLSKHELDYVPNNPRDIRTEIAFPKSLEIFMHNGAKYSGKSVVAADIAACSWTNTRTTGRVRYETLGWMLTKAEDIIATHNTGARAQAARKFVEKYQARYEEIGQRVAEFDRAEQEEIPVAVVPPAEPAAVTGVIVDLAGKVAAARARQAAARAAAVPAPAVEPEVEAPEAAGPEWVRGSIRDVGDARSQKARFLFGGKAGARSKSPTEATLATLNYAGEGRYEIISVESDEVILTGSPATKVWLAPAAKAGPAWKWTELVKLDLAPDAPFLFGGSGKTAGTAVLVTAEKTGNGLIRLLAKDGTVVHESSPWRKIWHADADADADADAEETEGTEPEALNEKEEATVEPEAEPAPAGRVWDRMKVANLVNMSSGLSYFYFGGSAKGPVNESGPLVVLDWEKSKRGRNPLTDVDTGEEVTVVHSASYVWAARVDRPAEPEQLQLEETVPEEHEEQVQEAVPAAGCSTAGTRGPAPANWVAMAEEADTKSARAWWSRKVAAWNSEAAVAA
ncbi:hypothetical protein ACIRBX_12035 [Kitasatospora sp. NPDC096147]|uniref:hypothetical protein n=1 Tax=Kitasatospora sp. NPDC096147 TaxID=3364093 RepID=UPI00380CDE8C